MLRLFPAQNLCVFRPQGVILEFYEINFDIHVMYCPRLAIKSPAVL